MRPLTRLLIIYSLISDYFTKHLELTRLQAVDSNAAPTRKKKKLMVEAGKSISTEEVEKSLAQASTSETIIERNKKTKKHKPAAAVESLSDELEKSHQPSTSGTKAKTVKKKKFKTRKPLVSSSSDEDSDGKYFLASESDLDSLSENDADGFYNHISVSANKENRPAAKNDYVVVNYEGAHWPGQVNEVDDEGAFVKCMTRCGLAWKWLEREDCILYNWKNVLFSIQSPKRISTKRELYNGPELENEWGKPKK